jgi:hypothetical protein
MNSEERLARRAQMLKDSEEHAKANLPKERATYSLMTSFYADVPALDTSIGRFIFPVGGRISRVVVYAEKKPKDGLNVTFTISKSVTETMSGFFMKDHAENLSLSIEVVAGDRLTVKIPTPEVKFIWVGITLEVELYAST